MASKIDFYFIFFNFVPTLLGVGLNDSPVGLAAYILEKFTTWTNPAWKNKADGGLLERYTYTKLLDNVMIYWVTNSITTSMRLYSEAMNKDQNVFDDRYVCGLIHISLFLFFFL